MDMNVTAWGPKLGNQSYVLEMDPEVFGQPVHTLVGYSLGAPEAETQDAVMFPEFAPEGGFIVKSNFYARKAYNLSFSYEIVLAPGEMWSVLNKVANSRGLCKRDFYANYLCPADPQFGHFIRFPDGILDEIIPTSMLISTTDDEEALTHQTTLRSPKRMTYYALGVTERSRLDSAYPYYAIAYRKQNCANCPDNFQLGVAGGGNGTAAPEFVSTEDRFATSSDITNSLPAGSIITDIYASGDVVVATFANQPNYSIVSATTGGIVYSTDGGVTTSIVSGVTGTAGALLTITRGGNQYWAAGRAGVIWRSYDLVNWTQLTHSYNSNITDLAYDKATGVMYAAGYDGSSNGDAFRIFNNVVSEITTEVNAGANRLYSVAVLAPDHVAFGGVTGVFRENTDASGSETYTTVTVGGTTTTVMYIGGDRARTIVGAGTNAYERSRLTDGLFKAMTVNPGTTISGIITGGDQGNYEGNAGLNYFLLVTDQSEALSLAPFYPNS